MFLHIMHGYILKLQAATADLKIFEDLFGIHSILLVFAGLHDAADYAEGQRSRKISKILHWNPGHDVSPEPLQANVMSNC